MVGKRQKYEEKSDNDGDDDDDDGNDLGPTAAARKLIDGNRTPNSLAEWSRSVDTEMFKKRREEIHRQKRIGKKPNAKNKPTSQNGFGLNNKRVLAGSDNDDDKDNHGGSRTRSVATKQDYLRKLANAMKSSPSSPHAYASNNKDAAEIYKASKKADQLGETDLAIQLLESLLEITPKDARLYRRLSRMHNDQGHHDVARATLQKGLRLLPDNPWLWHGMGRLELSHGRTEYAVRCFQRAIQEDPAFAHSYHAWGVHEFSNGQIAKAMKILKRGIEYSPTNHRLHHALGDLFRGAKLLQDAERCYKRALEEGPAVSNGFALSALACVAYEQGNVDEARHWLYRSIETNNGRHAQGWMALAQLEEAEGNVEQALTVCEAAIIRYEKEMLDAQKRYKKGSKKMQHRLNHHHHGSADANVNSNAFENPTTSDQIQKGLSQSVPKYRSGDKFFGVFRHWARLEGRYGTHDGTNRVYERASSAFPWNHKISLDWALYHAKLQNVGRARTLFAEACSRASTQHADPYREYASFEMSLGQYDQARKILFRGAQTVTRSSDGGLGSNSRQSLAQLYVTWAVCEWHLGNIPRVEVLFDHALRLTEIGSKEGSELRSFILFCIAKLEYFERDEIYLAQHCIGLCLKENSLPVGNAPVWKLWARVAHDMGNVHMEEECLNEAKRCRMLLEEDGKEEASAIDTMNMLKGSQNLKNLMRQQPWHDKLQTVRGSKSKWNGAEETSSPSCSLKDFYSGIHIPKNRNFRGSRNERGARENKPVALRVDEQPSRAQETPETNSERKK